jgi:hypothetical protein
MRPISNLNSVYIKNTVPEPETLAVIRELTKLGIIKSKRKAKKERKTPSMEEIKQESDMVGYVKNLGGTGGGGQFPFRLLPNTATPQQIEDFNRSNSARIAALQGEIAQNRSETQQTIGGLAGAASQRFANIQNVLGQIVNPATTHFRGSTFPASSRGDEPIDPFYYARGGRVPEQFYLPDVTDVPMDQTLNEGGPVTTPNISQDLFPVEEPPNFGLSSSEMGRTEEASGGGVSRIMPQQKIGGGLIIEDSSEEEEIEPPENEPTPRQKRVPTKVTRKEFLRSKGLGQIPPNTKNTTLQEMYDYYVDFCSVFGVSQKEGVRYNKAAMYKDMVAIVSDGIDLTL